MSRDEYLQSMNEGFIKDTVKKGWQKVKDFFKIGMQKIKDFIAVFDNKGTLMPVITPQAVIDKFAMYAGKKINVKIEGYGHFLRLSDQESGFVQLSSHMGNYEIAGYSLVTKAKHINAIVYMGEKSSVMENRKRLFSHTNLGMIPIREDMSHLFEIDRALCDGEIISIPGDRIWGSQKALKAEFLGHVARFPMGPYSVATMRGLDVLAVNVMKSSWTQYTIYVTPLSYDKEAPRKRQTDQLLHAYIAELERLLKQYPTQWYNYFDFWKQ